MNREIYIISPTHIATGGTELLQQLCFVLRNNNIPCSMYYLGEYGNSPVENKFFHYNNPSVTVISDTEDSVVVVPETHVDFANKFKKAKIYYWWLSVDNYYGSGKVKEIFVKKIYHSIKNRQNRFFFKSRMHLVQSQYAYDYLIEKQGIENNRIRFLSDYLSDSFLQNVNRISEKKRENCILYNPRKGYEYTRVLIQNMPEYKWIPLVNLTHDEMIEIMLFSKVYVDFGNHPGKDRIPREAAICGCCIITGDRGSAANDIDIPINSEYKFSNETLDIEQIRYTIDKIMCNYESCIKDYDDYRRMIMKEELKFQKDAISVFG